MVRDEGIDICVYACMCTYMCVYVCVYIHMCVCACAHVCVCIHICISMSGSDSAGSEQTAPLDSQYLSEI